MRDSPKMFSEKEEVGELEQPGNKDGSFATLRLRSLRATLRGSRDSDDRTARKSDTIRKATQVLGAKVGIDQNIKTNCAIFIEILGDEDPYSYINIIHPTAIWG